MPEILSWGVAYKGLPGTLIDVDLRYIDYKDAELFGQKVSEGGLGWRSVLAVATGAQYRLSEKLTLRGGYLYNTNPIPSTTTLFNVQAPGITQHTLSLGASYRVTADITATAAWVHGFRNAIQGGVEQLPGASTRLDTQADSLLFGLNIQFGRMRRVTPPPSPAESVTPASATVADLVVQDVAFGGNDRTASVPEKPSARVFSSTKRPGQVLAMSLPSG